MLNDFNDFKEEIKKILGHAPQEIKIGTITRFHTDNCNKKNGWCKLFPSLNYGVFGDWSNNNKDWHIWRKDGSSKKLSATEYYNLRKQIEEEEEKERKLVFEAMKREAENLTTPSTQTNLYYIKKKGLTSLHGILYDAEKKALAFKFFDQNGRLSGFERIFPDGNKQICKGSRKKGAFAIIGDKAGLPPLFACEGWATGASINEATKENVIICIDAGNIQGAITSACAYFDIPSKNITIIADNDAKGIECAKEAQNFLDCKVIIIPIERMDANDYAQEYGIDALRKWIQEVN